MQKTSDRVKEMKEKKKKKKEERILLRKRKPDETEVA